MVETIFGALYAFGWLFLGWSNSLRSWLLTITVNDWALVALYIFVFGGLFAFINLPLGIYEGFAHPQLFGQSNQFSGVGWLTNSKATFFRNILKTMISYVLGRFPCSDTLDLTRTNNDIHGSSPDRIWWATTRLDWMYELFKYLPFFVLYLVGCFFCI